MLELANDSDDEDLPQHDDVALMESVNRKYHNILVYFGNEELQLSGTTKITKDIFEGSTDKTENALLFLENLDKIKQNPKARISKSKIPQVRRGEGFSQSDVNTAPFSDDFDNASGVVANYGGYNSESDLEDDQVLLNISPNKFEKPKDQLFIDFFSMYTKKFVEEKEPHKLNQKSKSSVKRSEADLVYQ